MPVVRDHALAVAVLVALQVTTVAGASLVTTRLRRAHLLVGLTLVLLAGTWLLVDGPLEGQTLWSATRGRGLTVGDLCAVPSLAVAAISLVMSHRYRPTAPSASEVAKRRAFARVA